MALTDGFPPVSQAHKADQLGQYLQPTLKHLPVVEFVKPAVFAELKQLGEAMGFIHVASGPLVRSSYHADEFSPIHAA